MIWILAFLCLSCAASIGFAQGPIRGIFALLGLFAAAFLASPVGSFAKPILIALDIKHPIATHTIPPIIGFIVVWFAFHILGATAHRKILFHHKYKEDDSDFYRWERVYQRLGTSLGIFCGVVFFLILLLPIYIIGYFTTQYASGENVSLKVRLINNVRAEMCSLKLDRVVGQFDPTPQSIYDASDFLTFILANRNLTERLARYPLCMTLAESPQFHALVTDTNFVSQYKTNASCLQLLENPKVAAIVRNPVVFGDLIDLITQNMGDLKTYIETGTSPKYSNEKILGIWTSNPYETYTRQRAQLRNVTASQIMRARWNITNTVSDYTLTATPNNALAFKRAGYRGIETVIANGTWKNNGTDYQLTIPNNKPDTVEAKINNNQLLFERENLLWVFDRKP
jgi:hypothetical protein